MKMQLRDIVPGLAPHDPALTNADQAAIAQMIDNDLRESTRARALARDVLDNDWETAYNERDEEYQTLEEQHDALAKAYDGLREAVQELRAQLLLADIPDGLTIDSDLEDILAEFPPRPEIEA